MKGLLKNFVAISALSSLAVMPLFLNAGEAAASPRKGTDASYIGAGFSAGVTNGGQDGDAATFGGNIHGRLKLGNTPFSARGQINFSDETSAIIPHVTVDVPIGGRTNAFVGAGYQFVEKDGRPTPSGNKDSVAVVAGVESQVSNNVLLYSNVTSGINAYRNSSASSVSINGGVGFKFR
ncbi:hypothetical protein [Calothrix sp. NIES-3974]|uniref:hypothetical protein n=1 Tax=Calothrix sp. NIES-3974 TaxID=2005462 RepID=UPI000B61D3FD|nr:hypothetical protein [Calothrix sp. NIES-3974]BAZ03573.1 hypothetical protein NIES3974_02020 [Calothrix sp. NIES-3974]